LTVAVEFPVSFVLQGFYMERLQQNPLKYGRCSAEVNWGEGGKGQKEGKYPLISSKMD